MKRKSLTRQQLAAHVGKLISSDRNDTHGDPQLQFECAQDLKDLIEEINSKAEHRAALGSVEFEVLDMICTKISRILCGSNIQDHWLDIAGYALIAAEKAEMPL